MKQECLKWLMRGGTTVLLTGAVGLLLWRGHGTFPKGNFPPRPQRLAAATVETTGTEVAVSAAETTLHWHPPDENGFCQACRTGFPRNSDGSGKHHAGSRNRYLSAGTERGFGGGTGTAAPHRAVLAERITAYRDQIGGFSNREQLLEVEGIGEATLYEIYDLLYLENETFPEPEPEPEPAGAPAPAAAPQPAETAPPATEPPAAAAPAVTFPLDLNQATAAELEQIPEMQPELAEKIVAFRQQIQAFSSVYELLYVDGMTEAYFVQLRDYVQITEELAQ
ncbi:MAG: helix-hairpin-helix domain-containing protein [Ruminococcus callidus]